MTDQIVELFPIEDKEMFFVPFKPDGTESRSTRGCLYNYYKFLRRKLRLTGILKLQSN